MTEEKPEQRYPCSLCSSWLTVAAFGTSRQATSPIICDKCRANMTRENEEYNVFVRLV